MITDFKLFEHNHRYNVGDIIIFHISIYIITETNYVLECVEIGQISYYREQCFIKISDKSESLFISEVRPLYGYESDRFFETLTIKNTLEIDELFNTNLFEELKIFNKNKLIKKFKI